AHHITVCLAHAGTADDRAALATDPTLQAEYSELARTWRHLARSYQFVESLERFLHDSKLAQTELLLPPSEPIERGTCPRCGKQMHFTDVERHPRYSNLDRQNFTCDCGYNTYDFVAQKSE